MTAANPRLDRLVAELALSVDDQRVLAAMRAVDRAEFVPAALRAEAYADTALPIGQGQTISQPTVVAVMTAALTLSGDERVLEIGTGSGYQAAVLARLAREVVSVEIVPALRERAAATLARLGVTNVRVLAADAEPGHAALGPYDAIIVTAAAPHLPPSLLALLAPGGRLVAPVGPRVAQRLVLVTRTPRGLEERDLGGVRFVPLRGAEGYAEPPPTSGPRPNHDPTAPARGGTA
jgi:protein-L-isoaspartate(D-aspartate) O-methyltransferase